ncbi:recombination protein RecR, partial [Candidatus Kuenenbacteria bacterium CG_4_9_14_3_um_filter_39_14]
MQYPEVIQNLIDDFTSLPGIGGKTAERLVFYLIKNGGQEELQQFGKNLMNLKTTIKTCRECGNYSLNELCDTCRNIKRDKKSICVVANAEDIKYLDNTHSFNGVYHVLGGLLNPSEGVTPDKLRIKQLLARLRKDKTNEIILGLNPTIEGESTIIYLKKKLKEDFPEIKITRLSRGLPMGGDLEYADEITLASAINN